MKLYYSKGACSLVVRIIIHELGLACTFEAVNLKTKETETGADFLQINPKGAVPALMINEKEVLTENTVIQQYLAEKNTAHQLLPAVGDLQRYRVLEWLNFVSTDLHKNCSPLFNPKIPDNFKEDVFKPVVKSKLTYVNQVLQQQHYLAGEHFTLPDAYLFVVLRWLPGLKINLAEFANLQRFFDNLKQRKSVVQALQEEGL